MVKINFIEKTNGWDASVIGDGNQKKRRHRLLWVGRKGNFWQPQNQNGKRNKYLSCLARNETVGRKPYKIKTKPNHLRDQYTNIFKALREKEREMVLCEITESEWVRTVLVSILRRRREAREAFLLVTTILRLCSETRVVSLYGILVLVVDCLVSVKL